MSPRRHFGSSIRTRDLTRLADEGVWREEGGPVLAVEGSAARDADRRADRAELPRAAVGRGDADRPCVQAIEWDPPAADPRHAQDDPGLRALEKAAVAAGGGTNHRAGLYDAILIKENHAALAGGVGPAVRAAAAYAPGLHARGRGADAQEVDEALEAGAPRILLDNMSAGAAARGGAARRRSGRNSRRAGVSRSRRSGTSHRPA